MLSPEDSRLIGGSDAAAVAGVSEYRSPIDVWRRIVEGADRPQTRAMRRGQLLEPVIRQMYQDETGAELLGTQRLRSKRYDFARASLDDLASFGGEKRVVEYKSANLRQVKRYGEGDDEVPLEYLAQVQWYLALAELPRADLAVLLAGDELRIYPIEADEDTQRMLFDAADRFWRDFILTRRPPPPDATEGYSDWLHQHYPESKAPLLRADAEAERWAQGLRVARIARELAEAQEREARQHLEALIGEHEGIEGEGWRVTYRVSKGKPTTDWRALCFELKVPPSAVEKYTKRTGYRVFRPTFGGSDAADK